MRNPIRNETSLVLVIAVIFSAVAIPVLSGFLEPSQPPAVAAVQVGDPRDRLSRDGDVRRGSRSGEVRTAPARSEHRATSSPKGEQPTRPAPAPPPTPAPPAPVEDLGDDHGGESD